MRKQKSSYLRNILASASAASILCGVPHYSAVAANVVATGNASTNSSANWLDEINATSYSSVYFGAPNLTVTLNTPENGFVLYVGADTIVTETSSPYGGTFQFDPSLTDISYILGKSPTISEQSINYVFTNSTQTLHTNLGIQIAGNVDGPGNITSSNNWINQIGATTPVNSVTVSGLSSSMRTLAVNSARSTQITLNDYGSLSSNSTINADAITLGNLSTLIAGGDVAGLTSSNTSAAFTGAGIISLGGSNLTGDTDFAGHNGTVSLAGGTVAGAIYNTGATGNGQITIGSGTSTITGAIGETNAISSVLVSTGSLITGSTIEALSTLISSGGTLTPGGNLTSTVSFESGGGTLNMLSNTLTSGTTDFAGNSGAIGLAGGTVVSSFKFKIFDSFVMFISLFLPG